MSEVIRPGQHPMKGKSYLARNEKFREMNRRRRTWVPVTVTGIRPDGRITIAPSMYGRLDVDPRYQRGRTSMIPEIIYAVQAGGIVPDVVDVAKREWGPRDGKLWILDGFQRACALQELGLAIEANVWVSENIEAEKRFFLAMQARKTIGTNQNVKAWSGPSADLLRRVDGDPDHPLYGRINFETGGGERLGAAIVILALERFLSGKRNAGDIRKALSRADERLKAGPKQLPRAEAYLCLLGRIFHKGYARRLPLMAISEVASEKWFGLDAFPMPSGAVVNRLRAVNWSSETPSMAEKFLPVLVARIKRIWR